jgi:hypothetical protein
LWSVPQPKSGPPGWPPTTRPTGRYWQRAVAPAPGAVAWGGGDIGNSIRNPNFNGRGGGRGFGNDRGFGFGRSSRGGGNGRPNNGNGSGRDGNTSKFNIIHPQSNSEAAGSAALLKESGRKAVNNDPELLGAVGPDIEKNPNSTNNKTVTGKDNVTVSFLESTKLNELAEKSILSSKQEFVSKNPTFAAKLANQLAESRVLYLFSSHEERLELSETQFNTVMGALEVQAIESAIKKEPAPKIKWCRYSKFGDTGYLGCQSVEDAKLIMAGVLKVVVEGIKFRAWAKDELESRHLASIDISIHQSNLGAPMVMKGFMAANTLQGKATKVRIVKVGGWCKVTRALYDTLKFFADDQLYEQLNERKNGDKGRRLYLIVGTGERQVHLSQ